MKRENTMRSFILGLVLIAAAAFPSLAVEIGDDGLHKQEWFTTTFKDIAEDIDAAREQGKRLAVIIEQRGCISCRRLHEEVLSDDEVRDYIAGNYMVVQYNMFGDEEVTDLDGETLTEKTAIRKWRIIYTPTILFMPESVPQDKDAGAAAVSVMPGAFSTWTTLNMFKGVREKGYEGDEHFQKYHARMLEKAGVIAK